MVDYSINGNFVCEHCRQECGHCIDELETIKNGGEIEDKELYPRKQLIKCLGKYCQHPCQYYNDETDLTVDQCVKLINWMGTKIHKMMEEKYDK